MGRILASQQTTDGLDVCSGGDPECLIAYKYNLAGQLTQETYPSGRIVHHNYGTDGKLTAVSSQLAVNKANKSYAQNFTYDAAGAVTAMQLGNMRWESTTFNSRLQPTKIALGTTSGADDMLNLEYTYGTSANSYHDNNGNVLTQTITVDDVGVNHGFVAVQTYTYDALNRLKSATENSTPNTGSSSQSWKQTYLYDRFGNRTFDTTSGATTTLPGSFDPDIYNPTIDPATNQFDGGQGYAYDAAGSVKQDALGKKFVFDGENKQTSFGTGGDDDNGGTYFYDADGHRVRKQVGAEVTIFVYNSVGQMVAEYTTTAPTSPQVNFLTADTLGTPRINTNATGDISTRHDYMPHGEEIFSLGSRTSGISYGGDAVQQKFTAKERDAESGLDYFNARYYSSASGRFNSVDPLFYQAAMAVDPQRFNLYGYCRNNPLKFVDPQGEELYLSGDIDWLKKKVLYEQVGGQAMFDKYFEVSDDGQVTVKKGVDISSGNSGVRMLGELAKSTPEIKSDNYLYYAGTDGKEAAGLFQGSRDAKGRETSMGRERADKFTGRNRSNADSGTLVGTSGRTGALQPANLANGDPVFAVIAYNTNTVQTQVEVDMQYTMPTGRFLIPLEFASQADGAGQAVRPASFFIHESTENIKFSQIGASNANYPRAHMYGMGREAVIRRELGITGGFAGGVIQTRVPK